MHQFASKRGRQTKPKTKAIYGKEKLTRGNDTPRRLHRVPRTKTRAAPLYLGGRSQRCADGPQLLFVCACRFTRFARLMARSPPKLRSSWEGGGRHPDARFTWKHADRLGKGLGYEAGRVVGTRPLVGVTQSHATTVVHGGRTSASFQVSPGWGMNARLSSGTHRSVGCRYFFFF